MSFLHRKRIQNHAESRTASAIREVRPSLEATVPDFYTRSVRLRDLRNRAIARKFAEQRKSNRTIIEEPYEIRPELSLNRDIRQLQMIHEDNKVRSRVSVEHRKPLSIIQLNGQVRVDLPPEHPICRERSERRAMMFAIGKAGKTGQRPRRDNNNIKLRCK